MTNKTIQVLGLIVASLTLLGGAAGVIGTVAHYQGQIVAKVEKTQDDIREIKTTIARIAPPTVATHTAAAQAVRQMARADAQTSRTAGADLSPLQERDASPRPGSDAPLSPPVQWHPAYLADHCRLCPTCCATAAAGDDP